MRRVVVQSEVFRRYIVEGPSPDHWRRHKVFAAGPFVAREKHRAILNADLDAMVLGEGYERSPRFEEARPIVIDALGPIAADEGIDVFQIEFLRGDDDFFEMLDDTFRSARIGIKRVRIKAESREAHAVFGAKRFQVIGLCRRETDDIDVRDAGVFALGFTDGPAHRFDTREAFIASEGQDLFKRELRKNGGDEAKFHASSQLSVVSR